MEETKQKSVETPTEYCLRKFTETNDQKYYKLWEMWDNKETSKWGLYFKELKWQIENYYLSF